MKNNNLIYTPHNHIPIGEPVILPNGTHALVIKGRHGNKSVKETVTVDKIHELIINEVANKINPVSFINDPEKSE